jgi:alkylation response protein AidB-like acyl-CoA dehydrogenase
MLTLPRTGKTHDQAARDLFPMIADSAADIERTGRLPLSLLDDLHEARLFHMLSPRSVGGEEIDPVIFFNAIEALASADASTAWCVGQGCGVAMASAYLDPAVAREIFGGPRSVVASGPNTRGARAVKNAGGYRVTARWMYASGSRHSQWLAGHTSVFEENGEPTRTPDGRPLDRTMLFEKSKATIFDDWRVMGLRGTGSDSYEVADLFVPEEHTLTRDDPSDRRAHTPLHSNFTGFNIFGLSFSALSLGVARGMMGEFVTLASKKSPQSAQGAWLLRDNAVVQSKVAIAEARLMAARGMVVDVYGRLWDKALLGRPFTLRDKADMRLASTFAMNEGREVVAVLYNASGGTAIFQKNSFERRFRDINCASQQGQASQGNFEIIGQVLLGMVPKGRV